MLPGPHEPGADWMRIVYVEFLPTRRQQEYPAAVPVQDWLETFERDLKEDYFGSYVGPVYTKFALDVPGG